MKEVRRVGRGLPPLWRAANSTYTLLPSVKEVIDTLTAHAPEFKLLELSPKQIAARLKVAFERVPEVDKNWLVVEFLEKLRDAKGEYLFHKKNTEPIPTADDSRAPHGVAAAFDLTKFQDSGSVDQLINRTREFAQLWDGKTY